MSGADSESALVFEASCDTVVIRGTGSLTGLTDIGVVHAPLDLSAVQFASFAKQHGELVRNDGVGTVDGTFTVPVPRDASRWELLAADRFGPLVAVGDARHPTIDRQVLGRLDAVLPTSQTDVSLALTGLEPWVVGSTTEITVGNNGAVVFSPEGAGPAAGATMLTSTFDWTAAQVGLVEASAGDRALVTQLTARPSGSEIYQATTTAGTAVNFTQRDGVASTLSAAMQPVPQSQLALRWRGDSFSALSAEIGAGAVEFFGGVFLDALPEAGRFGFYATAPDLLMYFPTDPTADVRIDTSYGNPYRSNGKRWDEFMIVNASYSVPVQLGSATPASVTVAYTSNRSLRQLDGVMKPRISPPRHVRFSGDDLHWDAPSSGHATVYNISVRTVAVSNGTTKVTPVMQFWTTDRSLRIPDDFVPPGSSFIAVVFAVDHGTVDRTTDLDGLSLPFESAPAVSATFTR